MLMARVLNKENKSCKELTIESLTSSPIIVDLCGQLGDAKKNEEVGYLKKLLDETGEEDGEVPQLNMELESLKAVSTQLSDALKDAQAECSDLMSESTQHQEANDVLEEQSIAFLKEVNEKFQFIMEVSYLEKEKLSSNCERLEPDVILKGENEKEQLKRRLRELENENKRLKTQSRSHQSMSEDLLSTLQYAIDTSEALLVRNKNLKSKVTLLESQLSSPFVKTTNDVSLFETKEFEHSVITEELEVSKTLLGEKEQEISDKERTILEREELIAGKERIIAQKGELIVAKEGILADKDATIDEKEKQISSKEEELTQMASSLREVENKLEKDMGPLTLDLEEKTRYIRHLEDVIVDQNYELAIVEDRLVDLEENPPNAADLEENVYCLEEEIKDLRYELECLQDALEAYDKTLKKTQDDKARREKDLNGEIESLRTSELKIKWSDYEKTKALSKREVEIDRLQKEVIFLLLADGKQKERIKDQSSEIIRILEVQIKRLKENLKDIQLLGKKIGQQQNFIDTLQRKKGRSRSKRVVNSSPGSCSPNSLTVGSENRSSKRKGGGRMNKEEETHRKRQDNKPKDQLTSDNHVFVQPRTPTKAEGICSVPRKTTIEDT